MVKAIAGFFVAAGRFAGKAGSYGERKAMQAQALPGTCPADTPLQICFCATGITRFSFTALNEKLE